MNRIENEGPPRWALAFFRWFCHPEIRENIEGDLVELYHHRRAGLGLTKAKWLLIKDILLLFRPGIIGSSNSRLQQFSIMKNIKWTRLVIINFIVGLMILSPFLPGPSNKIVLALSVSTQTIGYLGLALVPLGLSWTIIQIRRLRTVDFSAAHQKANDRIAIATSLLISFIFLSLAIALPHTMPKISFSVATLLVLISLLASWKHGAVIILAVTSTACFTFTFLVLTLAVFVGVGLFEGILALGLVGFVIAWQIRSIAAMKQNDNGKFRQLPIYLVSVPAVALIVSLTLMKPASSFSRDYAIEKSKGLIAAIEDYKIKKGIYPQSLKEVALLYPGKVSQPSIMGIESFRYEKLRDHYSIGFSQWLDWGSLEEIVLYTKSGTINKYSEQDLCPSCDYKCDLCRARTAFASYDTKHSDWKYYHCD
jgi:hypothetical protein